MPRREPAPDKNGQRHAPPELVEDATHRPDTLAIAARLRDIAAGLALAGENRFRVKAYERGAEALETFRGDLDHWIEGGAPHRGRWHWRALAAIIRGLRATGRSSIWKP